jgi:hypothetical protein
MKRKITGVKILLENSKNWTYGTVSKFCPYILCVWRLLLSAIQFKSIIIETSDRLTVL